LTRLASEYKKDGLVVLAVNAWDEDPDIIKQYFEQNKLTHRVLLNGGETSDAYGIPSRSVPTVFWINPEGIIADVDPGSGDPVKLEERTRSLLEKEPKANKGIGG
jgi:hypothetical protein